MTKDTKKPASSGRSLTEVARAVMLKEAQNLGPKVAYSEPPQKLNPTDGPARGAIQDLSKTDNENATGQNTTAGAAPQKLSPNSDQGAVDDLGHSATSNDEKTPAAKAVRGGRTDKVPQGRYPEQEKYNPTDKKIFAEDDIIEDDEAVVSEDEDDDDDKKGKNPFAKKDSSDDGDDDSDDKDDDGDDDDDDHKEPDGDECKKEDLELVPEEALEAGLEEANIPAHIDALFAAGGKDLSEEFKARITTVFEAAVREVSSSMMEYMNARYIGALSEAIETYRGELTEQVDSYLGYVVEQWVAENEVAIESGLRSELTEDFIRGLHKLFVENNIDVPAEKVDVIEELSAEIDELKAKLDEEFQNNVALRDELIEARKIEVFQDVTRGMTDVQIDKLAGLAESIATDDPKEFHEKLVTLKESYMTSSGSKAPVSASAPNRATGLDADGAVVKDAKTGQTLTEQSEPSAEVSPRMQRYAESLGRQVKSPTYTGHKS